MTHDFEKVKDELKNLSGYCPDHFDESPDCQMDCALFIRDNMTVLFAALQAAIAMQQVDALEGHEDNGRHFRNVYGLAYQKLNGYAVHNTEVLLFVMGFQGGTVHQVAKYLETTTDDILYADNDRMQDLMRKAQKLGRSRKLSEEKMSEAIFGAGKHDFNPESL